MQKRDSKKNKLQTEKKHQMLQDIEDNNYKEENEK